MSANYLGLSGNVGLGEIYLGLVLLECVVDAHVVAFLTPYHIIACGLVAVGASGVVKLGKDLDVRCKCLCGVIGIIDYSESQLERI